MKQVETYIDKSDPAYAGQADYKRPVLRAYDVFAMKFCAPTVWRCPANRLVELYDRRVSAHHLDIGVGTGYLLDRCRFPVSSPEITLMDLNPNPLKFVSERLERYAPRTHQANLLAEWGFPPNSFESVAMSNVLHCAPGPMREKAVAFEHARDVLQPGGTLFGSTVIAHGVPQTLLSRTMLRMLNRRGVFNNSEDSLEDLDAGLAAAFDSHEIEVNGSMALFAAKVK